MSKLNTYWIVTPCDEHAVERLARENWLSGRMARLLVNRGIKDADSARAFLEPSLAHLHDPSLLPDLDKGVDIVVRAIENGDKMLVHGDYDVDGVSSAALLVRTLRALKANVEYRLPHRQNEGYDIKPSSVDEAAASGVKLIITCDCGINAIDTARRASELGIDLIITDHHEPGIVLPEAAAVIDPKRHDAVYPFPELAGVGVALKFAHGIVRKMGVSEEAFLSKFLDLAALGTVADVVPLIDENRAIVKFGLAAMPNTKKVGIQTMLQTTNLTGKTLTAYYLGFVLGPRINSMGRMQDATDALRLLLTCDVKEASNLAAEMEKCNADRKEEQNRILEEAVAQVNTKDLTKTRVLVLSSGGWNTGVVGIVAGKIKEAFGRPAILICRDEELGVGVGSARSISDFNLVEALRACGEVLGRFGGHALAAGMSLPLVNLDEFEQKINEIACESISLDDIGPRVVFDEELDLSDITRELANELARMEPFGTGNPEPLFVTRQANVVSSQRVGDGTHLRLCVRSNGSAPIQCIAFGLGDYDDSLSPGMSIDICYNIRLNSFNGTESVQLVGKDICL